MANVNVKLFSQYNQWMSNQDKLAATADSEQYKKMHDEIASKTPTTFNFMDGKDAADETQYNEQLFALASGEIEKKDKNSDGKLSFSEYVEGEISLFAQTNKAMDDFRANGKEQAVYASDLAQIATGARLLFEFLDNEQTNSAATEDGFLDADELAQFYKSIDKFDDGQLGDIVNGEFDAEDGAGLTNLILSQFTSNQDLIDTMLDMYAQGDKLEALTEMYYNAYDKVQEEQIQPEYLKNDERIKTDDEGNNYVSVEKWSNDSKGNNCVSRIIYNCYDFDNILNTLNEQGVEVNKNTLYKTIESQLGNLNQIENIDLIYTGQEIKLPNITEILNSFIPNDAE